jgi:hypothetical protein
VAGRGEIVFRSGFGEEALAQRGQSVVLIKGETEGGPVSSVRNLLRNSDLDWDERVRHTYDDADLAAAELLVMRLGQVERSGGIACGTGYVRDSDCPVCGGVRQVGPLKIDSRDFKGKKVGLTYDHDRLELRYRRDQLPDPAAYVLRELGALRMHAPRVGRIRARTSAPPRAPRLRRPRDHRS